MTSTMPLRLSKLETLKQSQALNSNLEEEERKINRLSWLELRRSSFSIVSPASCKEEGTHKAMPGERTLKKFVTVDCNLESTSTATWRKMFIKISNINIFCRSFFENKLSKIHWLDPDLDSYPYRSSYTHARLRDIRVASGTKKHKNYLSCYPPESTISGTSEKLT